MTVLQKWKIGLLVLAMTGLMSAAAWAQASDRLEVVETDGEIQWAKIDPALRDLEDQNNVTVRALRAFGRLPDPYNRLVLDLRKDDVDLLAAGPEEIRELAAKAESGKLRADPELLRALLSLLENREYHEWTALQAGEGLELGPDTVLRGQGRVVLQDAAGLTRELKYDGDAAPLMTAWAAAESDSASASKPETSGTKQGDMAKSDGVPGEEKPGTPDETVGQDWPRTWAEAPGMRVFGSKTASGDPDEHWPMYAALCPAPDGGYLAAAGVDTSVGLQTWVVRYDGQGVPLWSRTLGGPFSMRVTGAVALENNTFLLGGILSDDQPGFLLALDEQGEVVWSQTPDRSWKEHGGKDMIWAVAAEGKNIAAAGQVLKENEGRAVLLSLSAEGGEARRTEFADGLTALAVLSVGDDWIVGGESAPDQKPWLAGVNAQGEVVWSKTYGEDSGRIATLLQTPAGEILAAGTGPMWRVLGEDGEQLREIALNPSFDGVQAVGNVQGLALDAAGAVWLTGETKSEDGWLAKVSPDGEPQWLNIYGQAGKDALKAVLPGSQGATAAGRSFSSGGALWLVQVDDEGIPLSAEKQETVLESLMGFSALMGEAQNLDALHVIRTEDALRLAVPFVTAENGLPGFSGYPADCGVLFFQGKATEAPGRWDMTAELPSRIQLRGKNGLDAGVLVADSQKLSFVLDENLATALALDMDVENLRIEPLENSPLHGLYADLVLEEQPECLDQISLARLSTEMELDQAENGRWEGPLTAEIKDWQRIRDEKKIGELKKLHLKAEYEELDLAANKAVLEKTENMLTGEDFVPTDLSDLVQTAVRSMGAGQGELTLTDFFLADPDPSSEDRLAVKEIFVGGDVKISGEDSRDVQVECTVKGVDMQADSGKLTLDEASAGFSVDRFNFVSTGQAAVQAMTEENLDWQSALSKILGGMDIRFGLENLQFAESGQSSMELSQADLALTLSDLDDSSKSAGEGKLALTGFRLADPSSEVNLGIEEIIVNGGMKPSGADSRDIQAGYTVKGVDAQMDSSNVTVGQASAGIALDRLNFAPLVQIATEETTDLQSVLSKILGGTDIRFGVENLQVVASGLPPMKLSQADLGLALSGLDTPLAGLALTYGHKDAVGIPMIPQEVLPESARFDLALENLPVLALLADSTAVLDNPLSALGALAEHGAKLHIKTLDVNAPLGGLFCTAEGAFEKGQDQAPPVGRLLADIKVLGFKDILVWMNKTLGESGQEILPIGEALERIGQPEENMLRYAVEADTGGQIRINDRTMDQILSGGGDAPAQ